MSVDGVDIPRPEHLDVLTVSPGGRLSVNGGSVKSHVGWDAPWLPGQLVRAPSRLLLGGDVDDDQWGQDWERQGFGPGAVAVGGCSCGEVACSPLVVVIAFGNGLVRWGPFRTRRDDDLGVGPFVFAERRYRAALGFTGGDR